ncbi:A/G-specific adenine glycosylase [Nitrosomonas sp. Nm166]|uniref:A/G-specific adenine glycosylase n=1 Tax=Nitrosomonas sp. Nm166 TaxID=1881054 RepID=UPI0008E4BB31|nr:A/G-specific adenine glycosylase [Nitrosomonas sp. Nm166]SFE78357.1 A/G-specific adenine glycosylase [Nitrosomonas sp. Nm166]
MSFIAIQLIHWHKHYGRHHLPWQGNRDPYAIWLSEIMLQQTQVNTVIPYYVRFMREFPTISSLAQAPLDSVLALWSGLGYYSRARNLHQTARILMQEYQGQFPDTPALIQRLPGIGRSTAAAIAVFAFGKREAILDGNVKRIFARHFGITGYPGESKIQNQLWDKAEELLPVNYRNGQIETYTQALMDLGATVCTRHTPLCPTCPLQHSCIAYNENRVDQLPTPKPRKPLPQKETIFLLLMRQQNLLLEKRPAAGIWGELWCPPEISIGIDAAAYCRSHLGIEVQLSITLPALDHQFTHFKLRIYPQLLQVVSGTPVQLHKFVWIKPVDALEQAIPTPVRKLLQQNFLADDCTLLNI